VVESGGGRRASSPPTADLGDGAAALLGLGEPAQANTHRRRSWLRSACNCFETKIFVFAFSLHFSRKFVFAKLFAKFVFAFRVRKKL
jgi:hypothetical protein